MGIYSRFIGVLAAALVLAGPGPSAAQTEPVAIAAPLGDLTLKAADGRDIPVFVFPAAEERAVVVFSHGLGAEPRAYQELLERWAAAGFTVLAPLHVDSLRHPGGGRVPGFRALTTRIADLAATRARVKSDHAARPLIVAGHSFGSLLSVIQGGAVTAVGPHGDPDVAAIVAISSAGDLEGLVTSQTYASLAAPLLVFTGDADTVETYAPDWRAHRSPFDRSPPGDRMLVIFEGGGHNLVRDGTDAQRDFLAATSLDFLRAHALGDAEAEARLTALAAPGGVQIERR